MILVLSGTGKRAADIAAQLDLLGESYVLLFSDFAAAGRYGEGNVLVGGGSVSSIRQIIKDNAVTAVIDTIGKPCASESRAALDACERENVTYVKYVRAENAEGAEVCLSYREIADKIARCSGNVLFFSADTTVSAIAELAGDELAAKMYAPVPKSAVFDTGAALEFGIPIINVIEADILDGRAAVSELMRRTDAKMLVCDGVCGISDKIEACAGTSVGVIVTHNMGFDFPNTASTARDAVILARHG